MENSELNQLIDLAREAHLPSCPGDLEANVFRRIRLSREVDEISLLEWLFAFVPRKEFLIGALALAVFTSSFATFIAVSTFPGTGNKRELAGQALDFSVFHATEIIAYENH